MTRLEEHGSVLETPDPVPATTDDTFDERWARWQTKGQEQDARMRGWMRALGVLVAVGAAAALVWAVTFGGIARN